MKVLDYIKKSREKKYLMVAAIIVAAVVIGFIYAVCIRCKASTTGSKIGMSVGSVTGRAIGSLEGMTIGRTEGTKAGKEKGISAEDTEAIVRQLHQVNNLEVLVASVKLSNFHTIGDSIDYAALYLVNGNVVFTIDLSKAEITLQNDKLHIMLPKPIGKLYLNDSSVKKAAEYQKNKFKGNAKDGFEAYLNTMSKLSDASEETLDNYDVLVKAAKESAERQVLLLARSVSIGSKDIAISFAE